MKRILILSFLILLFGVSLQAQDYVVKSPDGHIVLNVSNRVTLTYSVQLDGKTLIAPSPMGFQLKNEPDMKGNFKVENNAQVKNGVEEWTPVVRNKHSHCSVPYQELILNLKEKDDKCRRMDVAFRVMNDGVAFRYTLYGTPILGNRQIVKELTGYAVPEYSSLWIPNFKYADDGKSYKSSQEGEFVETPVKTIKSSIHAGLPGLIKVDADNWMALTEANLDNYPAFYLGRTTEAKDGFQLLDTKLTPIWGENEDGVKVRFSEKNNSSWRVIMVGHNPGKFIESEIVRSLNPDCVLKNTSWIKPGMSAWDHWWSGEVKMEQNTIKEYRDVLKIN